MTTALPANLVGFVRALRAEGLRVGPATAAAVVEAIEAVGFDDREDLRAALRAVTVVRPAELPVFERVFERFFGAGERSPAPEASATRRAEPLRGVVPVLAEAAPELDDELGLEEVRGGSYAERLATRDFGDLGPAEAEEVRRLIAGMLWRPADTPSRRWRPARAGARPDLRRTLRRLTGPEGDLVPLAWRVRRIRRRPLVVLADVSGSMERYTEMILHFVHAAQGRLGRVEAFVFATRLTRITRQMRRRSPAEALAAAATVVEDWSGGTRIGEAFAAFNRHWSRRVTRGGAIVLVVSDGWDTGDPDLLALEAGRLARSVHRVIWLNPLAGRPGFSPETRGMRAVLPHVDHLLAAGTLGDLREVVALLESIPARRAASDRTGAARRRWEVEGYHRSHA